jgi:hypothetical protein
VDEPKGEEWIFLYSLLLLNLSFLCANGAADPHLLSELKTAISKAHGKVGSSQLQSIAFVLDALQGKNDGIEQQLSGLLPKKDFIDFEIIANISALLESVMYAKIIGHVQKISVKAGPLIDILLEWIRKRLESISIESALDHNELMSNEPLADAMLPITVFVIDESSANFIHEIFVNNIVTSWRKTLLQFERFAELLAANEKE